ncbi:MAG: type III PLP-dependent enzyme [Rhodospirillaceae bacterium]|nr:type III PLP-dependent enzyme [Rhodospirillaceae bacterium]
MAERQFADVATMIETLQPSYPVYCLRPHVLRQQAKKFLDLFPGRVLYAIKCNPHPAVVRILYESGIRHFDTASLPEIAQVRETFPDAGAYFMHPVKGRAVIQAANRIYNVDTFVVDHMDELTKILDETDGGAGIEIIVRINTPPVEGALFHLAEKFGAGVDDAAAMLREAHSQGCQVGLAFHVGSQCTSPKAYSAALALCGEVIEKAKVTLQYLDVGGGFPAPYLNVNLPPLEDFMEEIQKGVEKLNLRRDCVLMCEPGRALVAEAMSVVVQVQLRKDHRLYINDGVYGSFNEVMTAKLQLPARAYRRGGAEVGGSISEFVLNGPTCDSLDVLPTKFHLPGDIREGDWIEVDRIGAYSNAIASRFNGFSPETLVLVNDQPVVPPRR